VLIRQRWDVLANDEHVAKVQNLTESGNDKMPHINLRLFDFSA
jgi:hypothetical protein